MRAHGRRNLHTHVTEAAQTDDADLVTGAHAPLAQRRIGGDTGAEQGRHGCQFFFIVRDAKHKRFAHHDGVGVTAVGVGAGALFGPVVGASKTVVAILLKPVGAGLAVLATVNHAAHADEVADLEFADQVAHSGDTANNFMARHRRVNRAAPFIPHRVQVGVAHAAKKNVERDIGGAWHATFKSERSERRGRGLGSVTVSLWHKNRGVQECGGAATESASAFVG